MQDATVAALHALDHPDVAAARARIETYGEARATSAAAPIHTRAALLLLFDVLVGITTGRLRHDQGFWHTIVTGDPDPGPTAYARAFPTCGTYRCVAGWLVKIRYPDAEPVVYDQFNHDGRTFTRHTGVRIGGARFEYADLAARALDVTPTATPEFYDDAHRVARASLVDLFASTADLPDLWQAAANLTGGAITIPGDLVPLVARRS